MSRRSRACEDCQRLKIKCDVSTSPTGVCERCQRNNLNCIPAAPRLQRDRIAALEAEVTELREQLRQSSSGANTASTTSGRTPGSQSGTQSSEEYGRSVLSFLDARIPLNRQEELLRFYAQHAGTVWPVVRLPALDELREKSPILLLAVLVYTVTQETQGTEVDVHRELMREAMHIFGDQVLGRGDASMELVQALLVTSFWFKTTGWGEQGSCYQLIQLATDMAIDLGIGGPSLMTTPIAYMARLDNSTSLEARRTWLACFLALAKSSISTRRPNPIPWDSYLEECLIHLENQGDQSDLMLGQIVRITRLIQDVSNELCLCQITKFVDGNEYATQRTMETLKSKVEIWTAEIPTSLAPLRLTLEMWRHFAMVYIHEIVLHTPTNKASFAAPFIPGRIAIKDLPAPAIIIPPLRSSFEGLIQHCHAVVETVVAIEPTVILSLPFFSFAPTVVYSLYVLVTALVAATAPENTYGQILARDQFGVEWCNYKLRGITAKLKALDPTFSCFTTRLFEATEWLETWYDDYAAILQQYDSKMDET
ncbi:Transcription factor himD [Paramyrothecium foliicola]|nr:Transcription factor himD [Paramyrothecium foliicola]